MGHLLAESPLCYLCMHHAPHKLLEAWHCLLRLGVITAAAYGVSGLWTVLQASPAAGQGKPLDRAKSRGKHIST